MGDRPIQMSREEAGRLLHELTLDLACLADEETLLDSTIAGTVDFISDAVSGAGRYRDYYERDVTVAENDLREARTAMDSGNISGARRFLSSAAGHIESARSSWGLYINANAEGAGTVKEGAIGLSVSTVSGGIGGFVGLALALHGAGLAAWGSFSSHEDAHDSQGVPNEAADNEPIAGEAEQGSEAEIAEEAASQCIAPDQMIGETADIPIDECARAAAGESEDEKVFRAIDGPVSGRAIQREVETLIAETARAVEEWKPPIVEVPAPPADGYKIRSREELVAEAQRILAEWKENPNTTHDYAAFLIDSEFAGVSGADAVMRHNSARFEWDRHAALWKAVVQDGAGMETLMGWLFQDYLRDYSGGMAQLTDFLEGRGGNCESETKLVTAAFAVTGVKLKGSELLAVQVFADHTQPVVYDRETGNVRELISGAHVDFVQAPLYNPHILFHAFLKKQGAESPVSEAELLIPGVKVNSFSAPAHSSGDTNTNLEMPSSDMYFSDAPVLEHTTLPSPYSRIATGGRALSLEEYKQRNRLMGENLFNGEAMNLGFTSVYSAPDSELVFGTQPLADEYSALPTPKAKREFLVHLALKYLQTLLDTPEMKLGLGLLAKPSLARGLKAEDMERAVGMLKRTADVIRLVSMSMQDVFGTRGYGWEEQLRNEVGYIRERIPLADFYIRTQTNFSKEILDHPAEFIAFLDRLSPEQRRIFLTLLGSGNAIRGCEMMNYIAELARRNVVETLVRTDLISLKTRRPGYEPRRRTESIESGTGYETEPIWIDLASDSSERVGVDLPIVGEDRAGQKGEKVRTAEERRIRRGRYEISKDTMIALILECERALPNSDTNSDLLARRWTPALSRRFLRLNHDGRYDNEFLLSFQKILDSRYQKPGRKVKMNLSFEGLCLGPVTAGSANERFAELIMEGQMSCEVEVPVDLAEIMDVILKRHAEKRENELAVVTETQN